MPIGPIGLGGAGGGGGGGEGVFSAAVDLLVGGATDREGIEIGLLVEDGGADWVLRGVQRKLPVRASATVGTGANTVTITLPTTLVDEAGGNNWSIRLVASGTSQVAANVGADLANVISVYVSNTGITLNQIKSLIVAASVLTDSDIVVAGNGGTILPRPSSTQTTNFTGGVAEESLQETVNEDLKTYTLRYNETVDLMSNLVALINFGDNAEATLIAGTDDTDHPEAASALDRPFEGRRGAEGPAGAPIEGRRLAIDPSGTNNRTVQLPADFATYDSGIIEWAEGGQYVEVTFDVGSLPSAGTRTYRSGGSRRATYTASTNAFTLNGGSFSGGFLYDAGVGGGGSGSGSGTGGAGVDQTARDAAEAARALAETARHDVGVNAGLIRGIETDLAGRRRARIVYESVNSAGSFAAVDTTGGDIYIVRVAGSPGTGLPWNDNGGATRTSGDVLVWYATGGYWVEINEGQGQINRLTTLSVTDVGSAAALATVISAAGTSSQVRLLRVTANFTHSSFAYKSGDLLVWDNENSQVQVLSRRAEVPAATAATAGVVTLANSDPLGPATSGSAGSDSNVSRSDHRHPLPSKAQVTTILEGAVLPDLPAEGSRDNKVPKFDGNTLGWEVDATAAGGSGLDQAAVDARVAAGVQDWAETGNNDAIPATKLTNAPGGSTELTPVIVPATTTAVSFGIQGQSTWPSGLSRAGGLSGTVYWRDYRDLHGLQFIIDSDTVTADININMADLMSLNAAGGGRDETKSRLFEIINNRSTGGITFSGGGISNIRPTGARLEPGYKGLVSLTPWKVNRWLLSLGAFTPLGVDEAAIATAVSAALPPFFAITPVPSGIEGTTFPDHIDIIFTEKRTTRRITGVTLSIGGNPLALDAATPISNIDDATELRGVLQFNISEVQKTNLGTAAGRTGVRFLSAELRITFDSGDPHVHDFAFLVNNDSYGPHPASWAERGQPAPAPGGFSPTLVHSGNVSIGSISQSVDAGFDWPADADYLLVSVEVESTPPSQFTEKIHMIRNPRLGSRLGDSTPVTTQVVGQSLNDDRSIGFFVTYSTASSGTASAVGVRLGRTATNRALIQMTRINTDPMPLTVMKL